MIIYTIYKSVNTINGKVYIGFDSKWPNRKTIHKSASQKQNYKFYRAIRKYGWDKFEWSVIYQSKDKDHTLKVMENFFINEYNSFHNGYNSTLGGEGTFGHILSEESKQIISIKNQIPKPQTPEHIKNRTESRLRNLLLGVTKPYVPTDEHKRKISLKNKGVPRPMSIEHKQNLKCHTNNSKKVECPHCGKIGQLTNMKRWHFDRCKHNSNRLSDMDSLPVCCIQCKIESKTSANFYQYHGDNCQLIPK
jgi:group I intron endonuclease